MIFLFLNSHPTFIRGVVSIGKKVSEASLQIVPKYLSQTWRARSNYCCQPPFKVLLTQVASHLKSSPHTSMYQSDSEARLFPSDKDNRNFNDFIDSELYDICWQFFESNCALYSPFKKSLGIYCVPAACLFLTFFLLSSSFRLCLVSGVKAVRESVSRTDMVGARSLLMNNLGSHVTLLSILHQILSRKYQIFPT